MTRLVLYVPSISCQHCRDAIEKAVSGLAGVDEVDVNIDSRIVKVARSSTPTKAIVEAIESAGYKVETHTG